MRDDFREDTKRVLAARAGNRCSNPGCRAPTSGPQVEDRQVLNVGVAAHVTAASAGGPRFDGTLSADERLGASNGIWLCQTCAKLVDNDPIRFNVDVLRDWKVAGEGSALSEIGKPPVDVSFSDARRKAQAILAWKDRRVTLAHMNSGKAAILLGPIRGRAEVTLVDCNDLFVTIRNGETARSISLSSIDVSFDNSNDRLELQERLG